MKPAANVIEMPTKNKALSDSEKAEVPPREELIRRARFISALGRFTRLDERRMVIESEEIGGIETKTLVRRNARKVAVCNCPVYLSATMDATERLTFCCEHKIALRLRAALPKPSEAVNYNPESTTLETMIETNQLIHLKKMARDLGIVDAKGNPRVDDISWQRLGCTAASLSREAAQFLIDYLLEVFHFENASNSEEIETAA